MYGIGGCVFHHLLQALIQGDSAKRKEQAYIQGLIEPMQPRALESSSKNTMSRSYWRAGIS